MENIENNKTQDSSCLEKYAIDQVNYQSKELNRLVKIVTDASSIAMINGKIYTEMKLTIEDLEVLAMKIPAECQRLQMAINRMNIKNSLGEINVDSEITKVLEESSKEKKGTAEERRRFAELSVADKKQVQAVNKWTSKSLQAIIERADKTYEGVKKVLDYRSKEGAFDRKGGGC